MKRAPGPSVRSPPPTWGNSGFSKGTYQKIGMWCSVARMVRDNALSRTVAYQRPLYRSASSMVGLASLTLRCPPPTSPHGRGLLERPGRFASSASMAASMVSVSTSPSGVRRSDTETPPRSRRSEPTLSFLAAYASTSLRSSALMRASETSSLPSASRSFVRYLAASRFAEFPSGSVVPFSRSSVAGSGIAESSTSGVSGVASAIELASLGVHQGNDVSSRAVARVLDYLSGRHG